MSPGQDRDHQPGTLLASITTRMSSDSDRAPDESRLRRNGDGTRFQRSGGLGSAAQLRRQSIIAMLAGIGSGLLAQQPTPRADETVAVTKVCPQCGGEYETADRFCPKDGTPLRPKVGGDPLIGRVIAERYLVLARLGEGGMGRVYLAEHVKMNRQCAIKVMNPSLLNDADRSRDSRARRRTRRSILHPNVAAMFDYGEPDKIVYLVMEYVDGESLSAILARERRARPARARSTSRVRSPTGCTPRTSSGSSIAISSPTTSSSRRNASGKEIAKVVDFGIAKALTDSRERRR